MKLASFAALALLACPACATIPDLTFEDAGSDGSAATAMDGAPADVDGAPAQDGSPTTPPLDAGADADSAACPGSPPPGATTCCGVTPCVGSKCAQRCAECAPCVGKICCVPNSGGQQATCADTPQRCPNNGGNGGNGG